jgi:hypothetical protein
MKKARMSSFCAHPLTSLPSWGPMFRIGAKDLHLMSCEVPMQILRRLPAPQNDNRNLSS